MAGSRNDQQRETAPSSEQLAPVPCHLFSFSLLALPVFPYPGWGGWGVGGVECKGTKEP